MVKYWRRNQTLASIRYDPQYPEGYAWPSRTGAGKGRYVAAEAERIPVILDTDIGTNVDDIVALAALLREDAIDLRAVTTVYANAALRARIVKAVLLRAGRVDVPVGCGVDWPLVVRGTTQWEGWEGEGILEGTEEPAELPTYAVDLMTELVLADPGSVTIVAIGPLTNLALAMAREPRLISAVRHIVVMGGIVQRRPDQLADPYAERNIRHDPEAARLVLTSGAPITLVPLDVTTRLRVRRGGLAVPAGDGLAALVGDQLDRYFNHVGRDWTYLHDALAAALPAHPQFVRTSRMYLDVETRGDLTRGQTVATLAGNGAETRQAIDVALDIDVPAFESWLIPCLTARSGH
jgi:purine nucleosidase